MTVNLICLSANAAAGRRPASFALGGFEPASGWTPGWSFFIGLLPVSDRPFRVYRKFTHLVDVDVQPGV